MSCSGYKGPDDITGSDGLLKQLTKAVIERTIQAEMTEQLGYEKSDQDAKPNGNRLNGKSKKTLRSDQGPLDIEVPRDRAGEFEPAIVPKHQREFKGFDDKILSMYSRGMATHEIAGHLFEGDLRDGRIAGAHQPRHGFGQGDPGRVALALPGTVLPGPIPGRAGGQTSRMARILSRNPSTWLLRSAWMARRSF